MTGLTTLAIALGVGRFLLTPLLPLMRADAGLSLVAGGWLASINNVGYLLGALLCSVLPIPQRYALRGGLMLVAVGTMAMGLTNVESVWLLARLIAGVASAVLVVHGIAWSLTRLRGARSADGEALVFCGTGVGILLSGVVVAGVAPFGVTSSLLWIGFGVLCAALTALLWPIFGGPAPLAAVDEDPFDAGPPARAGGPAWSVIAVYGLLGFGYVVPATFLPLIAADQLPSPGLTTWFWPLYGLSTSVLTLLMPRVLRVVDNRQALAGCCASMALGTLLSLLPTGLVGIGLATVLIGGVLMPFVMVVMREARLLAADHDPTRLVAQLTAAFGIGQILGPLVAAGLAQRQGNFHGALWLSMLVLSVAFALCWIRGTTAARQR